MTPSEPQGSDPFDTRPSLPADNLQTNWPGLDPSTPYPLYGIATPPPPLGFGVTAPERPRWLHSTQLLVIGLLSLAVVLLSVVILSFHQGGITKFLANMPAPNATKTQSTAANGGTTAGSPATPSGNNTSTSSPQQQPPTTAPTTASPSAAGTATPSAATGTIPTASTTATSVPALTVTFTCQSVGNGQGKQGSNNLAQICVQTSPNAQLTIAALRCNGHSDDNLKATTATADSNGNMQWSWNMQDPGSCGQEHVIVTAKASSGQTAQNAVYLQFMH